MTQAIVDIGDPTQDRTPAVRLGEEDTKSERNFGIVTSIISVLWILAIIIANHNPVIHMVETRTSERIEFNLRESLGRTPPLARQVKLLAIDDPTFAFLGGPSPSLEDWAKVLTNIADKKPRAILMDKLFAETPADTPANRAAGVQFRAFWPRLPAAFRRHGAAGPAAPAPERGRVR